MTCYIVIVTYNGMKWVSKCIESCIGYEIIMIDNASTDETISFVKKEYPFVKVLPQSHNQGFGKANNIGISYAINKGADYIFLLNQDAYLDKGVIETLIQVHFKKSDYGILSPVHLNGEGGKLDRLFSSYISYDANDTLYHDALKGALDCVYEVPFVNAAGWLLPIKTIREIGGFDPLFFHYGEDNNYCQRLKYHGFKIGVVPSVFIYHDRELRVQKKSITLEGKLKRQELLLKVKWSNLLNLNIDGQINEYSRNHKKKIFKAVFFLKLNLLISLLKEYRMMKKIIPDILISLKVNKTKGMHYLLND